MRGDRPPRLGAELRPSRAAPHARGSTLCPHADRTRASGCPACAGIDPCARASRTFRGGLPRMRGDRPDAGHNPLTTARAAPHARGSTPVLVRDRQRQPGCPACAGIDPGTPCQRQRCPRLPRMRGDRPNKQTFVCRYTTAAPHARGSTQARACSAQPAPGCPACAGIDPRHVFPAMVLTRLPRMRGDRPTSFLSPDFTGLAAPHARGSTRARSFGVESVFGCPACAGIDPPEVPASWRPVRLPRMRGDRPGTARVNCR